jgi:nucleotide-binding universal stress UspA family protein
MYRSILFPTDFSEMADKSLNYIEQLKGSGCREVVLLHVINLRIIDGLMRHGAMDDQLERWERKAREVAEESLVMMKKRLELKGLAVKVMIKRGYPSHVILDVEKQVRPSLIVVGSHGRSNISDMLLGSVSDRVIRKSRHPVLVVKRDEQI